MPTPSGKVESSVGNDIMEKDGFSLPLKKLNEYVLNPQKSPDKAMHSGKLLGTTEAIRPNLQDTSLNTSEEMTLLKKGIMVTGCVTNA